MKQIGIWLLTRAGREIAELMPPLDEKVALRRAIELIDKDQLTKIMIGRATFKPDDQVNVAFSECGWSASGLNKPAFESFVSPPETSLLKFNV